MPSRRSIVAVLVACAALPGCARFGRKDEAGGRVVLAAHEENVTDDFPWAAHGAEGSAERAKGRPSVAKESDDGWPSDLRVDALPARQPARPKRPMPDVLDVADSRPIADDSERSRRRPVTVPAEASTPNETGWRPISVVDRGAATPISDASNGSQPSTGPGAFLKSRPTTGGRVRIAAADPQPSVPLPSGDGFDGFPRRMEVPLRESTGTPQVDITSRDDRISLVVRDAPVGTVLALIAQQQGLNVITSENIETIVSVTLQDVRLHHALSTLLSVSGYTWVRQDDIIVVTPISADSPTAPQLQGRTVRVFPLNFVAATDVQNVVTGLISSVGSVQIVESSALDRRRTQESLIVEDLPEYIERVAEYVRAIDTPPRQVLIEAYLLQVELTDNLVHGVDFRYLTQIAGADVTFGTLGFTNPLALPTSFLTIDGGDLDALIQALKTTTEVRTLASPKVLAVNGQEARIQIGQRLGYFVTTTTETSTLQNVDFLDLGVVLSVTPTIGDDDRILMDVRPQVSSGQINPQTGLPEEDTTEVQSTVMLRNGQAMIIGGLIQEEDFESQQKIPLIGDLWYVGRLFQRRQMNRRRSEVIVCLVPRIVPLCGPVAARELLEVERATSPVLTPDLRRARRDFEPLLPDATRNPRRIEFSRIPHAVGNLFDAVPHPPEYYFPRAFGPAYETSLPMDD